MSANPISYSRSLLLRKVAQIEQRIESTQAKLIMLLKIGFIVAFITVRIYSHAKCF